MPGGVIDRDPGNSSAEATVSANSFANEENPMLGRAGLVLLRLLLGFAGFVPPRRTR